MLTNLFQSDLTIKVFFMLLGLITIYLFFIRPRKKEEDERNNFLKTLKIGLQVVTIGGLYGKIVKINDTTVVLEIDPRGSSFVINKRSIAQELKQTNKKK